MTLPSRRNYATGRVARGAKVLARFLAGGLGSTCVAFWKYAARTNSGSPNSPVPGPLPSRSRRRRRANWTIPALGDRHFHRWAAGTHPAVRDARGADAADCRGAAHAAQFHQIASVAAQLDVGPLDQGSPEQRSATAQSGLDRTGWIALAAASPGDLGSGGHRRRSGCQRPQTLGRCQDAHGRGNLRFQAAGDHHDRYGDHGAAGCKTICAAGGYVLGQDEATSDVYGMTRWLSSRETSIGSSPWTMPRP